MNYSASSEWNKSGFESGWTGYLQESYPCPNYKNTSSLNHVYNDCHYHINHNHYESNSSSRINNKCCGDSEVDLSMVSDASSGPPQFLLHDDEHIYKSVNKMNVRENKSKKVTKEKKELGKYQEYQCNYGGYDANDSITNLDDTASSPMITYSKIQGDSTFSIQRDCWQYSHPIGADFAEPSHFGGRRFKD